MTIATDYGAGAPRRLGMLRQLATRFATVADQLLVALANFWLALAIGRAFDPEALAAYGIGLAAGLMVQALQRHTVVIPLMLEPRSRVLRRCGGLVGQHWIILTATTAIGGTGVAIAAAVGASLYGQLIVVSSAVCLILYAELEFARAMLVKLGRPFALLAGSAFYAALSGTLGWAALCGWLAFPTLLALLAAAMMLHAVAVSMAAGEIRLGRGWSILSANIRRYGGWSLVATGTYAGYNHIPLFILGSLTAPIHAAVFVATHSLMQPLQILLRGLDVADKAAFAERASEPHGRAAFMAAIKLAGLYATAAGLFAGMISVVAEPLLQFTYGPKFAGFGLALAAWSPVFILIGSTMPLESLVYARRRFSGYYFARAMGSVLAIGLTVPLVLRFAETGAILACAAGALVATVGAIFLLHRGTRR